MPYGDSWLPVWTALSDESLKQRVRHYFPLSLQAPGFYQSRFALLFAEANKRDSLKIADNGKQQATERGSSS